MTTNSSLLVEVSSAVDVFWSVSFAVIVALGSIGNGIVLWIILGKLVVCLIGALNTSLGSFFLNLQV